MKFSDLPCAARSIWAKSSNSDDQPEGHGLLAHMLDVAAVAQSILERESPRALDWAATAFGLPRSSCQRWLAALAGLHDFGKAIPGFQSKWPEGMKVDQAHGLAFPSHACGTTDHACATAAVLGKVLVDATTAEARWLRHTLQAISAHHGFHFTPEQVKTAAPKGEPVEWGEARQDIFHAYWQTLALSGAPSSDEISFPAVNWLAGLTSVADWIASNPEWFPLGERHDDLHDYYRYALVLAEQALNHIRWRPARTLLDEPLDLSTLLSRITGRQGLQARPLQQAGDGLLQDVKGPALLLVEAPMGEGKTELAFLAHLHLQAANSHRGMYVALPTQATGNALFKRALTFLEAFGVDVSDAQLVHAGASMNEDAQQLREIRLKDINQNKGESLDAATWFSKRRRPLLSPYGVGTVDQSLYAVLNVKHHFVRLWGLSNRVVILDEVHAYDTYTSSLIATLLQWLKALGSSVVLMSATLPKARRNELLAAWGVNAVTVPEQSYPRLLLADDRGVSGEQFRARDLPPIQLERLDAALEAVADKAMALIETGGCGAVIVNTVDRAQRLYRLLRERLPQDVPLLLFHARYPMDERSVRERQVLAQFGLQGERPQRALMIATQVAEQSLDLDFDFMLSDLAPVDLLLQRAGRLHRHVRERPEAHRQARLRVAGLQPEFPDLKTTAWEYVYDAYILGRTWALLGQEDVLALPGDIDRLVQAVYGDNPLPEALDAALRDAIEIGDFGKYRAKVNKERQEARDVVLNPTDEPQAGYANKPHGNDESDLLGLRNVTRQGRETVTLIPVEVVDGQWCIADARHDPNSPLDDASARYLYGRHLRLSRAAVVHHFKKTQRPEAFANHPLLRHCWLLPLEQGHYQQTGIHIRLDAELGLVYGKCEGVQQ
ncbi:CRISPR-associated helicase/endonuclease Cas3 [Lysobacteraceae bacterium NML120232]|nr:CRISPR-associated helicase/endonuclease Cas3 [Xanthomonadaceae bacterium NML120232]PJK10987.1 CRISPR-associated helicase/endonuclease Cas3 [Xanthomonadaceae bacterium NML08-0793]